jgi:hypothetical protein
VERVNGAGENVAGVVGRLRLVHRLIWGDLEALLAGIGLAFAGDDVEFLPEGQGGGEADDLLEGK